MATQWQTPDGARSVHELFKRPLVEVFGSHVSFDQTANAGKALQLCFDEVDFAIEKVPSPTERIGQSDHRRLASLNEIAEVVPEATPVPEAARLQTDLARSGIPHRMGAQAKPLTAAAFTGADKLRALVTGLIPAAH